MIGKGSTSDKAIFTCLTGRNDAFKVAYFNACCLFFCYRKEHYVFYKLPVLYYLRLDRRARLTLD